MAALTLAATVKVTLVIVPLVGAIKMGVSDGVKTLTEMVPITAETVCLEALVESLSLVTPALASWVEPIAPLAMRPLVIAPLAMLLVPTAP